MDLSWYETISPNMKQLLLGAGGSLLGGVGAKAVTSLLAAGARKVRKRFEPEPVQKATHLALAEALYIAAQNYGENEDRQWHLIRVFTTWLEDEAVAEEMCKLLDLRADSKLDLEVLEQTFTGLGIASEALRRKVGFHEFLLTFMEAFQSSAKKQPELQGLIKIELLIGIRNNTEKQLKVSEEIAKQTKRTADVLDPDLSAAWEVYLDRICHQYENLPMRGLDIKAADASQAGGTDIKLADVYIDLDTTTSVEIEKKPKDRNKSALEDKEQKPLSALAAFGKQQKMVLLGQPGSGKSTFVHHLCLCLAQTWRDPACRLSQKLSACPAQWLKMIPVSVVLRDLAAWLVKTGSSAEKSGLLVAYLERELKNAALPELAKVLPAELAAGRVLLLLDGLDEVPAAGKVQAKIRAMIDDLPLAFDKAPILVTCRVLSFQEKKWQLENRRWISFELAELNNQKISDFIDAWYRQLADRKVVTTPDVLSKRLKEAVSRQDLLPLARNPLLLTVMSLVHAHKGGLPDARALLYEDVVDLLLWRWDDVRLITETGDDTGLRKLMDAADLKEIDLKSCLWELAFKAHGTIRNTSDHGVTADIPEETIQMALLRLNRDEGLKWAEQMLALIKLRAGLLVESKEKTYTFPHRTFEEYLAACHLCSKGAFVDEAVKLAARGDMWREVILLAVGRLVHVGREIEKALFLMDRICPEAASETLDDIAWRMALLAGQGLMEIGLDRVKEFGPGQTLVERLKNRLAALVAQGLMKPRERADAGIILGKLGDPRKGVGLTSGWPDIDWIQIQPGRFAMGSDKENDKDAYEDELPLFPCDLINTPYRISRYPVTVVQYDTFVEAGGYDQEKYWTEAGWRWREKQNISGPENYREIFQTPNHPRVGVNWYEAMAFCNWLSDILAFEVTLPSEAQWERAARHTDGRIYPWGNEFDAARCNMDDTGIGTTLAVGIFPSGNAVCGAADMSGNVLEWCRTKWLDDYNDYEKKVDDDPAGEEARVLRGGAFHYSRYYVRCAYRYHYYPDYRCYFIGFRVVSPGSGL